MTARPAYSLSTDTKDFKPFSLKRSARPSGRAFFVPYFPGAGSVDQT
jgi:hypothetical protein